MGLFGQAEVTAALALAVVVARRYSRRTDWWTPLLIVVTVAIEALLKLTIVHPPPPSDAVRTVALLPFVHVPFPNSFPSGHVARTAFLLRIANGIPGWAVALGIVLMAATRVYLGEHWLSDTIGGAALGLGVAALARKVASRPSGRLRS